MTYQVDILNPKAAKLLQDLADLDLISLTKQPDDPFLTVVKRLRERTADKAPDLKDITREVENARAKRHAGKTKILTLSAYLEHLR